MSAMDHYDSDLTDEQWELLGSLIRRAANGDVRLTRDSWNTTTVIQKARDVRF